MAALGTTRLQIGLALRKARHLVSRAYLDHNATTPLGAAAREAMLRAFEVAGNPSSVHGEGRAARALIDGARTAVAEAVGAEGQDVYFTSGGTEALNIVLTPDLAKSGIRFNRLVVSAGEHPAVLRGHRFEPNAVEILRLLPDGTVDLDHLNALVAGEPVLLAMQAANNETGVVQPVREAAAIAHSAGGFVVCDAVQAVGKIQCEFDASGADVLALSAHKFGGPKGVGALCFAHDNYHIEAGVVRGGGQERGLRSGTENIIGIAGLSAAITDAVKHRPARAKTWFRQRAEVEKQISRITNAAQIVGSGAGRLPNTTCVVVPGVDAQVAVMNLDLEGVAVSAGSACAAGHVAPSHVLTAMGLSPQRATQALRVSLGWSTGDDDIELFNQAYRAVMTRMRPQLAA